MSKASRALQVGARVTTNYSKRLTEHAIIDRSEQEVCGSGVAFRVAPIVPGSSGEWMCADWFEPVGAKESK